MAFQLLIGFFRVLRGGWGVCEHSVLLAGSILQIEPECFVTAGRKFRVQGATRNLWEAIRGKSNLLASLILTIPSVPSTGLVMRKLPVEDDALHEGSGILPTGHC